jgi:hypothetical protein
MNRQLTRRRLDLLSLRAELVAGRTQIASYLRRVDRLLRLLARASTRGGR